MLMIIIIITVPLPLLGNITVTIPNYTAAAYDFIRAFRKGELGQVMLD